MSGTVPPVAGPGFGGPVLALLAGIAVVVFWWIGARRRLKSLRAAVRTTFTVYHAGLQQRLAQCEQLATLAAPVLKHERQALDQLTQARVSAAVAVAAASAEPGQRLAMSTLAAAEMRLVEALRRAIAAADAYPDLRADPAMHEVISALREGRAPLAGARQAFDAAVATYNAAVRRVPAALAARALGLQPLATLSVGSDAFDPGPRTESVN